MKSNIPTLRGTWNRGSLAKDFEYGVGLTAGIDTAYILGYVTYVVHIPIIYSLTGHGGEAEVSATR